MELLIIAVLAVLAAGFALYQYRAGGTSVRRAFSRLPLTPVEAVAAPEVHRLSGVTRAVGQAPVSQASGRPYLVQDLRIVPSDGESASTRTAQQAVDFLLDDGTSTVLVRTDSSLFTIDRDFEAPQTTLDKVPWVDALLRASGYRNGSPETCKIRIYEGVLAPGTRAGVIGYLEQADEAAAATGATAVLRSHAGTPVMIRTEQPPPA